MAKSTTKGSKKSVTSRTTGGETIGGDATIEEPARPGGKQAEESRNRMLSHAVATIKREGLDGTKIIETGQGFLDELDLKYRSVYGANRAWLKKEDFQLEVLGRAAAEFPSPALLACVTQMVDLVNAQFRRVADREEILAAGYETVVNHSVTITEFLSSHPAIGDEVGGGGEPGLGSEPTMFSIWIGIWGCSLSTPGADDDRAVAKPMRQGLERLVKLVGEIYVEVLGWLGYELVNDDDGVDEVVFGRLLIALLFGAALQVAFTPEIEDATKRDGGDEVLASLAGATDALIRRHFRKVSD